MAGYRVLGVVWEVKGRQKTYDMSQCQGLHSRGRVPEPGVRGRVPEVVRQETVPGDA